MEKQACTYIIQIQKGMIEFRGPEIEIRITWGNVSARLLLFIALPHEYSSFLKRQS